MWLNTPHLKTSTPMGANHLQFKQRGARWKNKAETNKNTCARCLRFFSSKVDINYPRNIRLWPHYISITAPMCLRVAWRPFCYSEELDCLAEGFFPQYYHIFVALCIFYETSSGIPNNHFIKAIISVIYSEWASPLGSFFKIHCSNHDFTTLIALFSHMQRYNKKMLCSQLCQKLPF